MAEGLMKRAEAAVRAEKAARAEAVKQRTLKMMNRAVTWARDTLGEEPTDVRPIPGGCLARWSDGIEMWWLAHSPDGTGAHYHRIAVCPVCSEDAAVGDVWSLADVVQEGPVDWERTQHWKEAHTTKGQSGKLDGAEALLYDLAELLRQVLEQ